MFVTLAGMVRKTVVSIFALATLAITATPSIAAAAPVEVTNFNITPSCVKPGGQITSNSTVQNTTYTPTAFYAQAWATEAGFEVYRGSVAGPYPAPPFYPVSQTQTQQIPANTPWGYYYVNLGIGPSSSSPTSWSRRTTSLVVSPFCW
jgi:hypothetical protein